MPLTPEQLAKIRQKEAQMPDALKRDPSQNYCEGWFFVTLNTRDEVPVLSTCEGSPGIADGQPGAPHCAYSEVGKGVMEVWKSIPAFHPGVDIHEAEFMPEHMHGLLYLKPGNREHLGQIIKGFMIGCSHAYWDTLGIPWRRNHPTGGKKSNRLHGVATPQYVDRDHTRSLRGPALFVHGYNDMEPITPEEVETKRTYIRDQARKRLIQGDRHDCFRKMRNQHSRNWTPERLWAAIAADRSFSSDSSKCQQAWQGIAARLNTGPQATPNGTHPPYMGPQAQGCPQRPNTALQAVPCLAPRLALDYIGNKSILLAPRKLPLVCHRIDAQQFERQKEAVLEAARTGAVIVSAFISPRERDIKQQLMQELLPFIEIMDNGFGDRYKPTGKAFYAMAENRLLQITPWRYAYLKDGTTLSREACLTMNELARIISGQRDDWWKKTSLSTK